MEKSHDAYGARDGHWRIRGVWWADSWGQGRTVPSMPDVTDSSNEVGGAGLEVIVPKEGPTESLATPVPAPVVRRETGTLVIYTARWVPVARYVEVLAEDLLACGVRVELVDVETATQEADELKIKVLPTFVWWGEEGPVVHLGALSHSGAGELCGVSLKPRRG